VKQERNDIVQHFLDSFRRGEEEGFSWVFEKYYRTLCYYALRFTSDKQWVEDVVQEVFINLWNKREDFIKIESIQSYLYRAVANHCINTIVKERRLREKKDSVQNIDISTDAVYHSIIQAELYTKVYGLIEQLPQPLSEVVNLYYLEGKGIRDIASLLGIPIYTVKTRRQRAIIRLRRMLPGYFRIFLFFIILIFF
jgi:RNA polymerase sigma-70 factor (family 1)